MRGASKARTQGASIPGGMEAAEDDAWRSSSRVRDGVCIAWRGTRQRGHHSGHELVQIGERAVVHVHKVCLADLLLLGHESLLTLAQRPDTAGDADLRRGGHDDNLVEARLAAGLV